MTTASPSLPTLGGPVLGGLLAYLPTERPSSKWLLVLPACATVGGTVLLWANRG